MLILMKQINVVVLIMLFVSLKSLLNKQDYLLFVIRLLANTVNTLFCSMQKIIARNNIL